MPRAPKEKDKDTAPVMVQESGETSTVGKSEKSVNPGVPPEAFPSMGIARRRNLVKHIALTALLTCIALVVVFVGLAMLLSSRSFGISEISPIVSPDAAPSPMMMGRAAKMMSPRFALSESSEDEAGVPMVVVPPYPEPIPEENAATPNLPAERRVIQSGSLTLLVSDIAQASSRIKSIATAFGGFVQDSSVSGDRVSPYGYPETRVAAHKRGSMTVRVPAERFDEAFESIKAIAVRVESESTSAQDVSAQYVDLEAQLKNLRAAEERYLALIDRAQNVEEILKVESYLTSTRANIERTQGRLNLLSRQVAMSTISIELISVPSPSAETDAWRPMAVLRGALQELTKGLIDFADNAIKFLVTLPLLLIRIALWVVALLIAWSVGKWLYGKVRGKALPPAGGAVS